MLEYITLQELDNLWYSASQNPNIFWQLIKMATSYINNFIDTDSLAKHDIIQEFDECCGWCQSTFCGSTCNDDYLYLNHIKPNTIVETWDTLATLTPFTWIYKLRGRKLFIDKSQILRDINFWTYFIKYNAWYDPLPEDIKTAIFMIISDLYNQLCRLCKDSNKDKTTWSETCDYNLKIELSDITTTPIYISSIKYIYNWFTNIININQSFSDVWILLTKLNSLNIWVFTYFNWNITCLWNKYNLISLWISTTATTTLTWFDFDFVSTYWVWYNATNITNWTAQMPWWDVYHNWVDSSQQDLLSNTVAMQAFIDNYVIPQHNTYIWQWLVIWDILRVVNPNNTITLRVKPWTDISRPFIFDNAWWQGNLKLTADVRTNNVLNTSQDILFTQSNCILWCADNTWCNSWPVGAVKSISQWDLKVDYRDIDTSMIQYMPSMRQKSSSDIQNIIWPLLDKYKKLDIYGSC